MPKVLLEHVREDGLRVRVIETFGTLRRFVVQKQDAYGWTDVYNSTSRAHASQIFYREIRNLPKAA